MSTVEIIKLIYNGFFILLFVVMAVLTIGVFIENWIWPGLRRKRIRYKVIHSEYKNCFQYYKAQIVGAVLEIIEEIKNRKYKRGKK